MFGEGEHPGELRGWDLLMEVLHFPGQKGGEREMESLCYKPWIWHRQ